MLVECDKCSALVEMQVIGDYVRLDVQFKVFILQMFSMRIANLS